jgi:hypothetical protein
MMETVLPRIAARPTPQRPTLRRRLAAMAKAAAERLISRPSNLPAEFFRFPLP